MEKKGIEWKELFATNQEFHITNKANIQNIPIMTNQLEKDQKPNRKKWAGDLNRHFMKEDI